MERLGIFYTSNDNILLAPLVKKVLKQLKKASNNVDILTSVFQPIRKNPFPQYLSPYTKKSYTTLALQILSLLCYANKQKKYKYVSFLEHDVLYPKGYFDYPDFDDNVLIYTNSLAVNKFGYFKLDYTKKHFYNFFCVESFLYQTTMLFDFAMSHFSKYLLSTLTDPNNEASDYSIEPFEEIRKNKIEYYGKHPIVHFDNGENYTAHFDWYDKNSDVVSPDNYYWGNVKKYQKYFPY